MEKYTWGQFWTVVIILVVIYYAIIYLVYYLPRRKQTEKPQDNNNDSNNINKSDKYITIFDSPFISNFDGPEHTDQDNYEMQNTIKTGSESETNENEAMEYKEDDFEMVGFDEDDVILYDDDFEIGESISSEEPSEKPSDEDDTNDLVELDEDMYEVTWESYTPGDQINLEFEKKIENKNE